MVPLLAEDGTLVFQHPTVRNYYDTDDRPEMKRNPYGPIMSPWHYNHPGYFPQYGYDGYDDVEESTPSPQEAVMKMAQKKWK